MNTILPVKKDNKKIEHQMDTRRKIALRIIEKWFELALEKSCLALEALEEKQAQIESVETPKAQANRQKKYNAEAYTDIRDQTDATETLDDEHLDEYTEQLAREARERARHSAKT